MKRRILVIGSNSFSGQDFIDLLLEDENNYVCGISRSPEKSAVFLAYKKYKNPPFHFYQIDLNKDYNKLFQLLNRIKPEYIVNFAAQSEVAPSWEHPEHWYMTNTVALARLGNYLRKAYFLKRYIHISSPEVYGSCKGIVKESAPLNPSTPYAASKAAADLFLSTLVKNFNFPLITIRSTNVYGPRQQLFKIIPRTVVSIKKKQKILLHGGGKAVKSYIHIRDISKGELKALKAGKIGEIYHLSPKKGISVADVVKIICKQMDVEFAEVVKITPERLGQDKAYIIDSTKAKLDLGWQQNIEFEEGINQVISWVNQNWSTIKKLPLDYLHKP